MDVQIRNKKKITYLCQEYSKSSRDVWDWKENAVLQFGGVVVAQEEDKDDCARRKLVCAL